MQQHRRHIRFTIGAGLALAVALAFLAWKMLPPRVEVARPVVGPAVQAVYGTGNVEATVMMPVAPRIGARLMALYVDEGANIVQGQLLAQLEDEDLAKTVDQLRAQETFARVDYERDARLLKAGAIARAIYDHALATWKAAEAATASAVAQTRFMKLLSPASGRIIQRDGEIGQLIASNQPLFWLACSSPLRISAQVDEEDIARVKPGQDVLIHADAFPKRVFHGRVESITPKGDPIARSYRVRIALPKETPLMIGMTTETNIVIQQNERALLVPSAAVEGGAVWRVRDGHVQKTTVSVGAHGNKFAEILAGLSPEDAIVVAHDAVLKAGEAVRVARPPS